MSIWDTFRDLGAEAGLRELFATGKALLEDVGKRFDAFWEKQSAAFNETLDAISKKFDVVVGEANHTVLLEMQEKLTGRITTSETELDELGNTIGNRTAAISRKRKKRENRQEGVKELCSLRFQFAMLQLKLEQDRMLLEKVEDKLSEAQE